MSLALSDFRPILGFFLQLLDLLRGQARRQWAAFSVARRLLITSNAKTIASATRIAQNVYLGPRRLWRRDGAAKWIIHAVPALSP